MPGTGQGLKKRRVEEGEEDSSPPEIQPDRDVELWTGDIPEEVKEFFRQEKDKTKFATHLSLEEMQKNKPTGKLLRKYTGGMLVATVQNAKDIKILRGVDVDPLVVAQVAVLTRNSRDQAYFNVLNYQGGWWVMDGKPDAEYPTKEGQGTDGAQPSQAPPLPTAPPPPQEPAADAWVDYKPGWKKGWQSKKW